MEKEGINFICSGNVPGGSHSLFFFTHNGAETASPLQAASVWLNESYKLDNSNFIQHQNGTESDDHKWKLNNIDYMESEITKPSLYHLLTEHSTRATV